MSSNELERSRRALYMAQDRIAELTQAQFAMSSTLGQLTEQATTDALSGLNNRRRFMEALKAAFDAATSQALPLSVVMIDVDSFKSYNDSFGHTAGDQVLWVVAKLLLQNSGSDHLVARYGGEEFATLLPGADASMAIEIAERQRAAIESHPWLTRGVSASFGISTLDLTTGYPGKLLEEADCALYQSKNQGRNRVTHYRALEVALRTPGDFVSPTSLSEAIVVPIDPPPQCPTTTKILSDPGESSFMTNLTTMPRPSPTLTANRPPSTDTSWDTLERYIQSLQSAGEGSDRYRDVLSAIREGTEADIVFLCNDQNGQVLEAVGDHVPFPLWHHQLTLRLADDLPSGGIWKRSVSGKDTSTVVPEPFSAILIPVKSPRSTWLVALRFRNYHNFFPNDLKIVRVLWQLHNNHHRHDRVHDKLKETLFGVVRCLSAAIDAKDPYTCGHSERVARIAVRLGEEQGLSRGEISDLYLAGLLHDLGKIGIRDSILSKQGPLTPEEYLQMQEHPIIGEQIIANVSRLAYLRPGVRGHHERYDGQGYPDRLVGDAIPQMARILAVADSCDAMMSARRYRSAISEARIEEIFREGSGTQWDPRIVQHFFDCRHELYAVIQRGLGQSVYFAVERAVGGGETMNGGVQSISGKAPSTLRSR